VAISDDREFALISEARELLVFYKMNNQRLAVTLFAEDFDFLLKRGKIVNQFLDADIEVVKGQRKKRKRRKRPIESLL